MAMLRWDPWSDMAALQRDVNQLFARTGAPDGSRNLVPAMDAHRTEKGLVLTFEVPGMASDDVEVAVEDGILTIAGERRAPDVDDEAWVRRERAFGRFERRMNLPEGTDPDGISAHVQDGLLMLVIPHAPERAPRKIPVGAGADASGQTVEIGDSSGERANA